MADNLSESVCIQFCVHGFSHKAIFFELDSYSMFLHPPPDDIRCLVSLSPAMRMSLIFGNSLKYSVNTDGADATPNCSILNPYCMRIEVTRFFI
jgi:hypothetical protein